MGRLLAGAFAFWLLTVPARALEVDVELLLAVDISDSIQPDEAQLQRDGYLKAILNPDTMTAIREGTLGRIALAYMEWADADNQRMLVGWTLIAGPADARAFAERLATEPIGTGFHTSISALLDVAVREIEGNGFEGRRRVVDVSGDGRNNKGRPLADARAYALARGITINGLPIVNYSRFFSSRMPPQNLEPYFREQVIGGPAAFMVVAENFEDFQRAIQRKLLKEIAGADGSTRLARAGFTTESTP